MKYGKTHRRKLDQEHYWRKIAAHLCCEYEVLERLPRAEALFRTPDFLCAWPPAVTAEERQELPEPNDPCLRGPYYILAPSFRRSGFDAGYADMNRRTYRLRDVGYADDSLTVLWREWERVKD